MEVYPGDLWCNSLRDWTLCTRRLQRRTNGKAALIQTAVNKQTRGHARFELTQTGRVPHLHCHIGLNMDTWLDIWDTFELHKLLFWGFFFFLQITNTFLLLCNHLSVQTCVSGRSKCVVRTQETWAAGNTDRHWHWHSDGHTGCTGPHEKQSESGRLMHANPTTEQRWLLFPSTAHESPSKTDGLPCTTLATQHKLHFWKPEFEHSGTW